MTIAELEQLQVVNGWVDFSGQITECKDIKSRTKANKLMQKLRFVDGSGSGEMGVWVYATRQFLPNQPIKGRGQLKEYNNVRYIDYAKVDGTSDQQPAPQQPAKAPPQSKPQSDGEKEMRIMRGNALNAVMSAMQIERGEESMYLAAGLQWIMTGRWQLVPEPDKSIQQDHKDENGDPDF